MVMFRVVLRKEAAEPPPPLALLGCNNLGKFRDIGWNDEPERLQMMDDATLIPSSELDGHIPQYLLWETAVFPANRLSGRGCGSTMVPPQSDRVEPNGDD